MERNLHGIITERDNEIDRLNAELTRTVENAHTAAREAQLQYDRLKAE